VLDHRHGKIWKVKIELYWFSRFAISIPYQTNSLSLSETLETSMPILGLKACMQLHKKEGSAICISEGSHASF